ncbi:MAG: wax ester/triacylglycerol synthase family O-acyltransferase [Acidobacteria bacterium]|nr:wax ester/triacylglycerol synthase family O-acyltransferase [Acidobacteriota bacterium]
MNNEYLEPLNNVDAAWRHMEDPSNLMMVTGVIVLEDAVPIETIKDIVSRGLSKHDRFRQKVVDVGVMKAPHWSSVGDLDWDYHLQTITLAGQDAKAEVNREVNRLMSEGLDFDYPLWQVHLIQPVGPGCAVLLRIHHCIADGMALLGVLLSLTGPSAEASLELAAVSDVENLSSSGNLFRQATNVLGKASRLTSKLVRGYFDTLIHPSKILDFARVGSEGAKTTARMLMRQEDPRTLFRGELGVPKLAAWSRPVPLQKVKEIKQVTGSTVNDVLLAAMSGALRQYLVGKGESVDGLDFHAAVPVNLRDPRQRAKLGNEFGIVFLSLPVGIADPLERIFEVRRRMEELKASPEAIISFALLKAVGATPVEVQKAIVNLFGSKTTAVMTNVPGPKTHLYMAGSKIETLMFWVPQSGRVGLGVSILSYAGEVRLGVATDQGLVPDPEEIIHGFHRELDAMWGLYENVRN